jgi:hypothetical protein
MIILAFFFLLRPGKYTDNDGNNNKHPFLLENIQLFIGDTRLNILRDSEARLNQARFVSLTFTHQKMGSKEKSLAWHAAEIQYCVQSRNLFDVSYVSVNMGPRLQYL